MVLESSNRMALCKAVLSVYCLQIWSFQFSLSLLKISQALILLLSLTTRKSGVPFLTSKLSLILLLSYRNLMLPLVKYKMIQKVPSWLKRKRTHRGFWFKLVDACNVKPRPNLWVSFTMSVKEAVLRPKMPVSTKLAQQFLRYNNFLCLGNTRGSTSKSMRIVNGSTDLKFKPPTREGLTSGCQELRHRFSKEVLPFFQVFAGFCMPLQQTLWEGDLRADPEICADPPRRFEPNPTSKLQENNFKITWWVLVLKWGFLKKRSNL